MTVRKHSWCSGRKKANTFSEHSVPHTHCLLAVPYWTFIVSQSAQSMIERKDFFLWPPKPRVTLKVISDEKRQIRFRNILFLIPAPFCLLDVPYWTSIWPFYYLYDFCIFFDSFTTKGDILGGVDEKGTSCCLWYFSQPERLLRCLFICCLACLLGEFCALDDCYAMGLPCSEDAVAHKNTWCRLEAASSTFYKGAQRGGHPTNFLPRH